MSSLLRSLPTLRTSHRALARPAAASLHTSSTRYAMSEAERDEPGRAQKIEKAKSESVDKAKSGKGEWKPELASQSEQSVQGEKSKMSMEEMQKMGKKNAEQGKTPSASN